MILESLFSSICVSRCTWWAGGKRGISLPFTAPSAPCTVPGTLKQMSTPSARPRGNQAKISGSPFNWLNLRPLSRLQCCCKNVKHSSHFNYWALHKPATSSYKGMTDRKRDFSACLQRAPLPPPFSLKAASIRWPWALQNTPGMCNGLRVCGCDIKVFLFLWILEAEAVPATFKWIGKLQIIFLSATDPLRTWLENRVVGVRAEWAQIGNYQFWDFQNDNITRCSQKKYAQMQYLMWRKIS